MSERLSLCRVMTPPTPAPWLGEFFSGHTGRLLGIVVDRTGVCLYDDE
ncbi:hypothetical protein [Desulfoplanes sp.]